MSFREALLMSKGVSVIAVVEGRTLKVAKMPAVVPAEAPDFIQKVTAKMIAQKGNELTVSQIPDKIAPLEKMTHYPIARSEGIL